MKFSEKWLREIITIPFNTAELTHALTMLGLEVEAVTPLGGKFTEVYVGEVLSAELHPAADKLRVCQVDVGESLPLEIVCGASNVRTGLKVAVAKVGAVLPGDFKIKPAKLRGVNSNGMICSAKELLLAEESAGILELAVDAKVGQLFADYLDLNDTVIELNVTPNRADCLSLLGVARELQALTGIKLNGPVSESVQEKIADKVSVTLDAEQACPRYLGRVVRGVNMNTQAPPWLQERLTRSGQKSINVVVDILNYVMLELGQPLHAFDLAKIRGAISVRLSRPGEKTILLDGSEINLISGDLVIADQNGPVALAGIMGGQDSAISEKTQDLFLESAFFIPETIAVSAKQHRLHSEASHRFERGVDYNLPARAIKRVSELLQQAAGGKFGPINAVVAPEFLPKEILIDLRPTKASAVLGHSFTPAQILTILQNLNLQVRKQNTVSLQVAVPSYRFDLHEEIDLIEELGRIYGYEKIPATKYKADMCFNSQYAVAAKRHLQTLLTANAWHEVITYSFIDPKMQALLAPEHKSLALANPIASDMVVMRTNFWSGLLQTVLYNQNRRAGNMRFFETGLCFVLDEKDNLQQKFCLGLVATGNSSAENWASTNRQVDFFDLKAEVMRIMYAFVRGAEKRVQFKASTNQALHPRRSADIYLDGKLLGVLGELHPKIKSSLSVLEAIYLAHLELNFIQTAPSCKYRAVSRFPAVTRDLAILVANELIWQEIKQKIAKTGGDLLQDVKLFDIYQGNGVELGQKSLAIHLTFQHLSRTFTDAEIENLVNKIVAVLAKDFNAKLRG